MTWITADTYSESMIPMIREMHVTFLLLIVLAVIENEKTVIANIRQKFQK